MTNVICADISALDEAAYRRLYEMATPERRERADRYLHREDALRCVAVDALLRYALGTEAYTVAKTPFGKPYIQGRNGFHYYASHSGSWVVLAFGESPVGVDVQQHRVDMKIETLAKRCFTPEEQAYVWKETERVLERFYEIWTGKESCLKFWGTGLRRELNSFSVLSMEPGVQLHHRRLPGGYSLTLCTADMEYDFQLLDLM